MFWIIVGTVLVVWNILEAYGQGFLFSAAWINGFSVGMWSVLVCWELNDRYKH